MNAANPDRSERFPVYLALGSNINPEKYLPLTIERLRNLFPVEAVSSAWQTPAVGFRGNDFLNAVVQITTNLSFKSLKFKVLRPLEAQLGRVRTENKFAPRTIDIDILLYKGELMDDELWIQPHLAIPLAQLYPSLKQKHSDKQLNEIARDLLSTSPIVCKPDILQTQTPKHSP